MSYGIFRRRFVNRPKRPWFFSVRFQITIPKISKWWLKQFSIFKKGYKKRKPPIIFSYGGTPGTPVISAITPARGGMYGNDTVTITGSNFSAARGSGYVYFNGTEVLSYTSWSDDEIVIVTKPHIPGAVSVKVQNNSGLSDTETDGYTYMESIYERILAAFVYNLGKITTDGGFNYTVKKVYDPPVGISEMYDYPAINIEEESETCQNTTSHLQTGGGEATLYNNFSIRLDCVLQSTENPRQARNQMLQDVQKLIGNNWYIPESTGDASAFNCYYAGSTPWGLHDTKPLTGISIQIGIWYTQKLTDPAKAG